MSVGIVARFKAIRKKLLPDGVTYKEDKLEKLVLLSNQLFPLFFSQQSRMNHKAFA